jgi:Predicted butyrate kinase
MVRVIGIDPGTVSLDLCGLDGEQVWLDQSLPTASALESPQSLIELLREAGPDLIAGPSGYGLPMVPADELREEDLRLAYLSRPGEPGGIGGLSRLARALAESRLPVVFTPAVIHLPTVPRHRKLNRVDLGTAEKVAAAALGVWDQGQRRQLPPKDTSFILVDLGGAFTALIAVSDGQVVDGMGGTSGPMGWHSSGAWDGEVAFLAGTVDKTMLFAGGVESIAAAESGEPDPGAIAIQGYVEGVMKGVLSLTASLPQPAEILLAGRRARDPRVRDPLVARLEDIAPVRELSGFAKVTKQGAQGAALIADGLAGGRWAELVDTMRLREASGTALDHLSVITPARARERLGL